MSNHRLVELLNKSHEAVLADWVTVQLGSESMRRDLIKEDELRAQSAEFLQRFARAVASGEITNIKSVAWEAALEILN